MSILVCLDAGFNEGKENVQQLSIITDLLDIFKCWLFFGIGIAWVLNVDFDLHVVHSFLFLYVSSNCWFFT